MNHLLSGMILQVPATFWFADDFPISSTQGGKMIKMWQDVARSIAKSCKVWKLSHDDNGLFENMVPQIPWYNDQVPYEYVALYWGIPHVQIL